MRRLKPVNTGDQKRVTETLNNVYRKIPDPVVVSVY